MTKDDIKEDFAYIGKKEETDREFTRLKLAYLSKRENGLLMPPVEMVGRQGQPGGATGTYA